MKSSQLKFANPHLNTIDFEIIPNSATDRFLGLVCVAGIVFTVLVFLIIIDSLPWNSARERPVHYCPHDFRGSEVVQIVEKISTQFNEHC